jgi:hypothetical protein
MQLKGAEAQVKGQKGSHGEVCSEGCEENGKQREEEIKEDDDGG